MEGKPLRILYLEDCDEDVELVQLVLNDRLCPCNILRAKDRASFEADLRDETVELVLSDYSLPAFNGLDALALAKSLRPELPFILLSGTISDALVKECFQHGADEWAGKSQLGLLPGIVRNVMEKTRRTG